MNILIADKFVEKFFPELEEKVLAYMEEHTIGYAVSGESKRLWIDLNRYIKRQLSQQNILWKRSRFEQGSE